MPNNAAQHLSFYFCHRSSSFNCDFCSPSMNVNIITMKHQSWLHLHTSCYTMLSLIYTLPKTCKQPSRMCPSWESRTGQLTRQYKTGITTVKLTWQKNGNWSLSYSQSVHKTILPGTQKANKICIHKIWVELQIKLQTTFTNLFTYRVLELRGAFEMSCLRS